MMRALLPALLLVGACNPLAPAQGADTKADVEKRESPADSARPAVEKLTDHPRVALVIGNGNYREIAKLENAQHDARQVAARLAQLGFAVELVMDADRAGMTDAITNLGKRLKASAPDQPKPVGLFYFWGHGQEYRGNNYAIPVDAKVTQASDLPAQAVDVSTVFQELGAAGNPFNIVVLDAGAAGLAHLVAPANTLLAYPMGSRADAEAKDSGAFTRAFLRHSARPGILADETFDAIAKEMQLETHAEQILSWDSTFRGEFAFSPCPEGTTFNGVDCGVPRVECDRGTWNGERCELESFGCPPGFEMVDNEGCRRK